MKPNARRSRSISDISSFNTVSVLSSYPIRVRALCVEEPQLGCRFHAWLTRLTEHARETRHVHKAPCPFLVSAMTPGSKTGPTTPSIPKVPFPYMPSRTRGDKRPKGDMRLCTTANINIILDILNAIKN